MKEEELSPCNKCHKLTVSIRLGRANYRCEKCEADKSLSDVFFYECLERNKLLKEKKKNQKTCCMCNEKGIMSLKEVINSKVDSEDIKNQAKLLIELGNNEEEAFCQDCFWK